MSAQQDHYDLIPRPSSLQAIDCETLVGEIENYKNFCFPNRRNQRNLHFINDLGNIEVFSYGKGTEALAGWESKEATETDEAKEGFRETIYKMFKKELEKTKPFDQENKPYLFLTLQPFFSCI